MPDLNNKGFTTRCVHAGERLPADDFTPVVTPIHPTVGFTYESMDDVDAVFAGTRDGFVYPRYGSPTLAAFETAMAELERGQAAQAYASGMAAIYAAFLGAGVRAGTHVVTALDAYGATITLAQRLLSEQGVQVHLVDVSDLGSIEQTLAESHAVALLAETISNPLLKVSDISALVELCHGYGAQLMIDNTFASPYLCNPLALGADYCIHSATKYIGGHGDVMAGVIVTSAENRRRLYELNKLVGGVLGPFEAWLAMRGCKTLALRMRQQCANAARLAEWLSRHDKIDHVNYPGLPSHPQHELAGRLLNGLGYGGMLSFEIAGADRAAAFRFMEALKLCQPATTLGDVYTLVLHPATSSHRSLSDEARRQVGIRDGLVRLSAGIEDVDDIIADLDQALAQI